jgi:hypothetical protein
MTFRVSSGVGFSWAETVPKAKKITVMTINNRRIISSSVVEMTRLSLSDKAGIWIKKLIGHLIPVALPLASIFS